MFLVKRPFRDENGFHATGSVADPSSISRFASRQHYGNIIEVDEHNFDKVAEYFSYRHGITLERSLLEPIQEPTQEPMQEPTQEPTQERVEPTVKPVPTVVAAVVK